MLTEDGYSQEAPGQSRMGVGAGKPCDPPDALQANPENENSPEGEHQMDEG